MKENEVLANFIIDKTEWTIIKFIASKYTVLNGNNKIVTATASSIIRELLGEWLAEKSEEWFPKLLQQYKAHNIDNEITKYLEQAIKEYEEGENQE